MPKSGSIKIYEWRRWCRRQREKNLELNGKNCKGEKMTKCRVRENVADEDVRNENDRSGSGGHGDR